MTRTEEVARAIALVVARKASLDGVVAGDLARMPDDFVIVDMAETMWRDLVEEAEAAISVCNRTVLQAAN